MNLSESTRRLRRLLHLVSRPGRTGELPGGLVIYPYRGYGSQREIFLMGRVFRQAPRANPPEGSVKGDLGEVARRLFSHGMSGVRLSATLNGTRHFSTSDRDGYFRFHMQLDRPLAESPSLWRTLSITPADVSGDTQAVQGQILVPPRAARLMVVSDIDDTVIFTGVANKFKMLLRLFTQGAQSRVAFPGIAALYRALHCGEDCGEKNPIIYVSRSPWSLYEVLDEFFNLHRIPIGPVIFLREWGLSARRPFPRRSRGHKRALIGKILELYRDLPCVLIGDSGQHDPEIYARIVREHPGRIRAVYIRNIAPLNKRRLAAIERLTRQVAGQGSSLFLASDTFAMAEHMAAEGLIPAQSLSEVLAERAQHAEDPPEPTLQVTGAVSENARAAIADGELKRKMEEKQRRRGHPPNVAVQGGRGAEGGSISARKDGPTCT